LNDKLKSKIIIRHALCWGAAFITPPIVMVVLDGIDMHTPTRIALFSTFVLMGIFPISHAFLATGLNSMTKSESVEDQSSENPA
jgi:hypothetical protein